MPKYYDSTTLRSKKDLNGKDPEIFITVGNRTGGKTTNFIKFVVDDFFKTKAQTIFLFRYSYETENCAEQIFNDVRGLFYPGYRLSAHNVAKGTYVELTMCRNDEKETPVGLLGYAMCLNKAEQIKKYSHVFNQVKHIVFDEFQTEFNNYLADEVTKFHSIHTSVARGNGEMRRYVPCYLISNPITILNPYYTALGITKRLKPDTKYIRGDGFVFEQLLNKDAAEAQAESGVTRALGQNSKYAKYLKELTYLEDSKAFIEKRHGRGQYLFTIISGENSFGVWVFFERPACYYVSHSFDPNFPKRYAVGLSSHSENTILSYEIGQAHSWLRDQFSYGNFRFFDSECRDALLDLLAIR